MAAVSDPRRTPTLTWSSVSLGLAVGQLTNQEGDGEPNPGDEGHANHVDPTEAGIDAQVAAAGQQVGDGEDAEGFAEDQAGDDAKGDGVGEGGGESGKAADGDAGGEEREDRHSHDGGDHPPPVGEVRGQTLIVCSTRDVEDAFRDATGELLISKSAVSEITDRLWEDYQTFISRDLSDLEIEYLFVDAVFESLRRHGAKEALLVGWAIAADGGKHLLHLAVGNKESEACWTEFFRSLLGRGLRLPTTITSDGAPGLVKAIQRVFPGQHPDPVLVPPAREYPAKLPDEAAAEVMAHVYAVRDARPWTPPGPRRTG